MRPDSCIKPQRIQWENFCGFIMIEICTADLMLNTSGIIDSVRCTETHSHQVTNIEKGHKVQYI